MTISTKRQQDITIFIICFLGLLGVGNVFMDAVAWAVQYFNVFNYLG